MGPGNAHLERIQAQGSNERSRGGNAETAATDSLVDQSPEVGGAGKTDRKRAATRAEGPRKRQPTTRGHEPWRHGTAAREGKASKGMRHRERSPTTEPPSGSNGARHQKHGEPHGRLQGAIDLQGAERSKPSESGGTTRAERVWRLAPLGRKAGFGPPGSGRAAFVLAEGRSLNPTRGVRTGPEGPRGPEGEDKDRANRHVSLKERLGHEIDMWSSDYPADRNPPQSFGKRAEPAGKAKRPAGRPADGEKPGLRPRWTADGLQPS
jgi:hypothetical protein